jgi:aerobic carbon-monoxide dehydrogenase medium subunit
MNGTPSPGKWKHPRFDYTEARTTDEACHILAQNVGSAKLIAGGTDLLVAMRQQKVTAQCVINIKMIKGLDYIQYDGGVLRIGVLTTLNDIETSSLLRYHFPIIAKSAQVIGTPQIRNVGTIGGNLCNAAPSADMAPSLVALGAKVKIKGIRGERTILLEDFFISPGQTALETDEMLLEIQVENPPPDTRAIYVKLPARTAKDIAVVGVAAVFAVGSKEVKIALGAVAPTPMRARKAETIVRGYGLNEKLIQKASLAAAEEAKPISDIRGTAGYRKEMVKVLTWQALRHLADLG